MLSRKSIYLLAIAFLSKVAIASKDVEYNIEHPELSLKDIEISKNSFWEHFQNYDTNEEFTKTWITSERQVIDRSSGEERLQYPVKWGIEEAYLVPGLSGDKGLVTYHEGSFAMIGRQLDSPIRFEAKDKLVLQYELKVQTQFECGGAFIKLLPKVNESDFKNYGDDDSAVLELLFGPDNCQPYTDEIHFGIRKTNPISKKNDLMFLEHAPVSKLGDDTLSHLYTLIIDGKTNDFEIRYDGNVVIASNLLKEGEFVPPFGGHKMIPNPKSVKPKDWDDRKVIPDYDQKKPEDWDDREYIPDPDAKKPESWDESIPEFISEPDRSQPSWWDEETDGEWVAPFIPNPLCKTEKGCGKWKPEYILNPDYQGQWKQPTKENPNYQGEWEPELIENPNHYEDKTPAKLENEIGSILFEFWSGSVDLMIDNIYLGKSVDEAELIGNKTFLLKRELEEEEVKSGGKAVPLGSKKKTEPIIETEENEYIKNIAEFVDSLPPIVQYISGGLILLGLLMMSASIVLKGTMALQGEDYVAPKKTKKVSTTSEKKETSDKSTGSSTAIKEETSSDELTSRKAD
ncbi:hypothetical protein Kpol_1049p16 [Vanderwaltozyma polyspora DSM 70294]|uniref:Calnexin n=1 Tax=Vanderwaltozyma polyspora (strain ATCC 22028 / DSM 70294 / BCRC 21397 / CBS 2163 / NBRC 10782 / NRRL Y-8283 / UCD 57-17) TaxID=436907 RepID=A7TPQ6_VANPO|nr:uncharacterized protein Kpol_1049p16 [Vanderwaltozyma polyspora DSM 70294]EDO15758.1 hypothetical protein Kpol_1049p16 [Vanderwaltozyma polyspora DSM 70294]